MDSNIVSLYEEARSALKAKDFNRASDLLRQILLINENYKDTSRLLAKTVKLRRRRWYSDPRVWGALGFVVIIALGVFLAPRLQGLYASPPTSTLQPTSNPTMTIFPATTATATETPLPAPTTVPLTWKRVSFGQEFPRDMVTALVIDPKDPEVLYTSMKYAGIYKSIDGGLSWQPSHHGLGNAHVGSLLIDPQNPQLLYAGTMGGIFKSEDGGENWAEIGTEIDVGQVEVNSSNRFQYNYPGIYLLMDPQDSSHLYARDVDNIYESTDKGKNWKPVYSSEAGCPGKMYSWAIHPTDGRTLFIGAGMDCEAGIYTSTDGGRTWTPLWLLDRTQNYKIQGVALSVGLDGQGNYYFHLGADLMHNESGISRTLLSGDREVRFAATFDSAGAIYFECNSFLCKFNPDEKQRLRLGKPEIDIFTIITIAPHDPNTIYTAGEGIAVSKDGGQTWSKRGNGLGGMRLTLETGEGTLPALYLQQEEECDFIISATLGEHKLPGQPLYTSIDGGQTWNLATETGCYLIKDTREPILYRMAMVQRAPWMWRSQDWGRTWIQVSTPQFGMVTAQSELLYLYIGFELWDETLPPYHWEYVSDDYGREWKTLKPPRDPKLCYGSTLQFLDRYRPMAIDPGDGNHVFVINDGKLLESHDSCDTTEPFASAPNANINSIAFDPNQSTTLYAGTDSGAYVSFDSGETWNEINDGLLGATVVYSIVVDKDSNVYAATPYGIFKLENG